MLTAATIKVLLLADEFTSARVVRHRTGPGTSLEIVEVFDRHNLINRLHDTPSDAILVEPDCLDGMTFHDVLEAASAVDLPIVVLGRDDENGADAVRWMEEGAADYLPISQAGRIVHLIKRLARHRETLETQTEMESELHRTREAMIKNQKLLSIGRLAGSIAHEINNPLESVTNLLYLLRSETNMSENGSHYVALAQKEMDRVAQISKQTLNFYRESRGAVCVSPIDLLEEVLVLYARGIGEKQICIRRDYRSRASITVFPGEIRQVLSNLVTNAIEASSIGGTLVLRIRDSRKWSDEGVSGIRIVIADHGTGIEPAVRQSIGQLFYTTKGQHGTGLGLWVTRTILKHYGGDLQLYSSTRHNSHGTVFSIFLPTNMRPTAVKPDDAADPLTGRSEASTLVRPRRAQERSGIEAKRPVARKSRRPERPQVAS